MTNSEYIEYLNATPERRLQILTVDREKAKADKNDFLRNFIEGRMVELTLGMDRHPDWHEDICECRECRMSGG